MKQTFLLMVTLFAASGCEIAQVGAASLGDNEPVVVRGEAIVEDPSFVNPYLSAVASTQLDFSTGSGDSIELQTGYWCNGNLYNTAKKVCCGSGCTKCLDEWAQPGKCIPAFIRMFKPRCKGDSYYNAPCWW